VNIGLDFSRPGVSHVSADAPPLDHLNYRPDIDGLRAVAVLAVMAYHAFPGVLSGGFIGVDIFFVISGFLISGIIIGGLDKDRFSFAEFYSRRIRRIFPALALVLTACYVFGWQSLFADEYLQLGKHIAAGAAFVANFALWSEAGYFDQAAETKPLLHLWSLGIEEQFYVAWPLILFLAWKRSLDLGIVILLILAASFLVNVYGVKQDAVATFYSPLSRSWELMAGAALAFVTLHTTFGWKSRRRSATGLVFTRLTQLAQCQIGATIWRHRSAIGGSLIFVSLCVLDKHMAFPGWWAVLPVLGAVLVISSGMAGWLNRNILAAKPLVGIGLISYPLYLWHWPLLAFARIVESTVPGAAIRIGALVLSFVFAAATYAFVEKPLRFKGRPQTRVAALVVAMMAIAAGGAIAYVDNGFDQRASIRGLGANWNQLKRIPRLDEQCKRLIGIDQPLFEYCRYNDVGSKETVALIGDSHAHAIFPGVAELFARRNKNVLLLGISGCPPLQGAAVGGSDRELVECTAKTGQLLSVLRQIGSGSIKSVVMTTRGAIYVSGDGFGAAESDYRRRPIRTTEGPTSKTAGQIFNAGLANTVATLGRVGMKVSYLLENPELGIDPKACLSRPFRMSGELDCAISLERVLQRQAPYRDSVRNCQGVAVIDPLPAFCPDGVCRALIDGTLLYADNNHLSIDGSRFLADRILARSFPD
jgi:peptidoglycan/LPS O-acetylase OafA/YrhL